MPKRASEWRVLIIALFVTAVLMSFFCLAGFAIFNGAGLPGTGR